MNCIASVELDESYITILLEFSEPHQHTSLPTIQNALTVKLNGSAQLEMASLPSRIRCCNMDRVTERGQVPLDGD